jgi:hypothetical protein
VAGVRADDYRFRTPGAVEGVGQLALTVDRIGAWSGALPFGSPG